MRWPRLFWPPLAGGGAWPRFHVTMTFRGSLLRSATWRWPAPPPAQGLYDPKREHDACGVGFVADLKGRPSHKIVEHGFQILENLTHRGAAGADPLAGDGAGILVQIPHEFLQGGLRAAQDQAAGARPLRRRPHVHAAQSRAAHLLRVRGRARGRGRRAQAARLARRADRQFLPVSLGDRDRADATGRSSSAAGPTSRTRTTSSAGSTSCAR